MSIPWTRSMLTAHHPQPISCLCFLPRDGPPSPAAADTI